MHAGGVPEVGGWVEPSPVVPGGVPSVPSPIPNTFWRSVPRRNKLITNCMLLMMEEIRLCEAFVPSLCYPGCLFLLAPDWPCRWRGPLSTISSPGWGGIDQRFITYVLTSCITKSSIINTNFPWRRENLKNRKPKTVPFRVVDNERCSSLPTTTAI